MISQGVRGEPFKTFLAQVIRLSGLKNVDLVLCEEGIQMYSEAFTHRTADARHNYEIYEFLGDVTVNKSIAWYLSARFPQLNCPAGVKILTRLRSNLVSRKNLAAFAEELYFWEFVSASSEVKAARPIRMLEDIFEAFIAVTEILVDKYMQVGAGYIVCHRLISTLLNRREIKLSYKHLFDAKTRTKEIFDFFGQKLGTLTYESEVIQRVHHVKAMLNNEVCLGTGSAPIKIEAEQQASEEAIESLLKMGFVKPLSEEYSMFLDME